MPCNPDVAVCGCRCGPVKWAGAMADVAAAALFALFGAGEVQVAACRAQRQGAGPAAAAGERGVRRERWPAAVRGECGAINGDLCKTRGERGGEPVNGATAAAAAAAPQGVGCGSCGRGSRVGVQGGVGRQNSSPSPSSPSSCAARPQPLPPLLPPPPPPPRTSSPSPLRARMASSRKGGPRCAAAPVCASDAAGPPPAAVGGSRTAPTGGAPWSNALPPRARPPNIQTTDRAASADAASSRVLGCKTGRRRGWGRMRKGRGKGAATARRGRKSRAPTGNAEPAKEMHTAPTDAKQGAAVGWGGDVGAPNGGGRQSARGAVKPRLTAGVAHLWSRTEPCM